MIPVALLLLAMASRADLVDEPFNIPAGEWRFVQVQLRQQPALVISNFQVLSDGPDLRVELVRDDDLARLRDEQPHGFLAATTPSRSGRLAYHVRSPGDYAVVIDNRAHRDRAARVRLRVSLDFAAQPGPEITRLSERRQLTVILISFAVFFLIVSYSARRLLRGIKQ